MHRRPIPNRSMPKANSTAAVRRVNISSDPMQLKRFEKKKNMRLPSDGLHLSKPAKGAGRSNGGRSRRPKGHFLGRFQVFMANRSHADFQECSSASEDRQRLKIGTGQ
jgi:hypothetical protein